MTAATTTSATTAAPVVCTGIVGALCAVFAIFVCAVILVVGAVICLLGVGQIRWDGPPHRFCLQWRGMGEDEAKFQDEREG